jgi:carboxylesterase
MTQLIPTAEPFFFPGSAVGVLLIHGFTGTPKEMRWMGEDLHRRHGFTCLGVRLAGHASRPADMVRSTYEDWLLSVEEGYRLLAGAADHIYLAGLSMGGVLALTLSAQLPVRGVIAMATPYALPDDWRLNYTALLSWFLPSIPKNQADGASGWFDQQAQREHVSYPRNPLKAIGQLNQLLGVMRATLPQVSVPALLIYSRDDRYLPLGSLASQAYIHDHLGSSHKEIVTVTGSGHVLTRDAARETVFHAAADFIHRLEN